MEHIAHHLGIDARTKGARTLVRRLALLRSTLAIGEPDPYREDPSYCQIRLVTLMDETKLDNWLYSTMHGADYVGVFTRSKGTAP
jgi:hypothetical protein